MTPLTIAALGALMVAARELANETDDDLNVVVLNWLPLVINLLPEVREKIFERFYTDRPQQGFGQNSGLGLSISKQIIDAHDGTIWVENRTGATGPDSEPEVLGARFIVRLPAM